MHTESSLLSKVAKGYFIANIFLPYHVGSLVGLAYHDLVMVVVRMLWDMIIITIGVSFDNDQHSSLLYYYDLFFAI